MGAPESTQGSTVQARSDSPRGTRKKPTVFQILTDKKSIKTDLSIFFLKNHSLCDCRGMNVTAHVWRTKEHLWELPFLLPPGLNSGARPAWQALLPSESPHF